MSAKTFNLDDPDAYLAYLEHAALQVALYGGLHLSFNGSHVTVHDGPDITITTRGPDERQH